MGILGMAVVNQNIIEAFILSCRAFDRGFEYVLINTIKENSSGTLYGIYNDNGKNKRFSDFFTKNGVEML
jgi:predicted enzyme involved in methoxymalonyl-ACP biosynthesis